MATLDPTSVSDPSSPDQILDAFLTYLMESGVEPYDHQENAILELFSGHHVILNTPTGSGKTLVALAVQFRAICQNRRSYYTVPVKALANEKFLSLCRLFGPEKVGMITGDATVNPHAPVICCTAEILSNLALREGAQARVDDVIMDEFHYYSDHERGVAWQIPLLTLPQSQFLLMSATLGDTAFFEKALEKLTGKSATLIQSSDRPVPLEFDYSTTPLEEMVENLVTSGRAPVYLVHFTQLACARTAQNLMSRNFCTKEEKEAIAAELPDSDFRSPYGKEIKKLLRHGLGIHHAGLLPRYRVVVEKLAQKGLLKVICGTDTLGVGVNVPIKTVLFTQLFKYGGQKTKTLAVRDFHQICGRAGRRGYDTIGYVVAQAPEHVINNLKAEQKAAEKGKKSFVKQTPPEGFVNWDENTFRTLIAAAPEKLTSQFTVNHGMLLHVLSRRDEDGCEALRELIRSCHEPERTRKKLRQRAFSLFRGLVEGRVLEILPPRQRTGPAKVRLNIELQDDFSLNQALGLYLHEAIPKLDREHPEYALQVLSLIEAIVEDPQLVLRKQVDKAKTEKMIELKAEGVEYDERIEILDEITYPQPGKEFIYATYNEFVLTNPWAKEASVRPKSIAREMFEQWRSFEDYVKSYGLERSEAVLLRHLSEVYKVLVQTVPPALKTSYVEEAEAFFSTLLRGVDSSLLDEWESMRTGGPVEDSSAKVAPMKPPAFTRDKTSFTRRVRALLFDFLKLASQGQGDQALALIQDSGKLLPRVELDQRIKAYRELNGPLRFDPEARNAKHFLLDTTRARRWQVEQLLIDQDGEVTWSLRGEVDLDASDTQEGVVFHLTGFGAVEEG